MQAAGAAHLLEVAFQAHDALADLAPVGLDLRLAGAAQEAEAAALAFEMGPGPHQARTLIVEVGEFHLQRAFPRGRTLAEDVEDQSGPVDHLAAPGTLEVALLHRRQRGIDDRDRHVMFGHRAGLQRDLALAEQGGGAARTQRQDGGMDDDEADRGAQPHRLGEARFGCTRLVARLRAVTIEPVPGQDDRRTRGAGHAVAPVHGLAVSRLRQDSSPAARSQRLPSWQRRTAGSARPA